MKHTPGPWFTFGNGHCVGGPESIEGAGQGIAMCGMRARTPEEAEANARLIAAAPDLLSALQDIAFARPLGPLPDTKWGKLIEKLERIAVNALDKAGAK